MRQVLACEEIDITVLGDPQTSTLNKSLFSGSGAPTRENIYKRYEVQYKNCPFIVASNELPQPPKTQHEADKFQKD